MQSQKRIRKEHLGNGVVCCDVEAMCFNVLLGVALMGPIKLLAFNVDSRIKLIR